MNNMNREPLLWERRKIPASLWNLFLEEFLEAFPPENLLKKKVFICGSYRPEAFQRLQLVKDEVNRTESFFAFKITDLKLHIDMQVI